MAVFISDSADKTMEFAREYAKTLKGGDTVSSITLTVTVFRTADKPKLWV